MFRALLLFCLLSAGISAQENGIVKKRNKYGYKENGEWIIRPKYDSIRPFSEGRAAVMKNGNWGFVNEKGKKITRLKYSVVSDYQGGIASVRETSTRHMQVIDYAGKTRPGLNYDTIIHVDSIAVAQKMLYPGRPYISIWKYPGVIIYNEIDSVFFYDDELLLVFHRTAYDPAQHQFRRTARVISSNGDPLTPVIFMEDSLFQEYSIITETMYKRQALLKPDGSTSQWFADVTPLEAPYFEVKEALKTGVMDTSFRIRVPLKYTSITQAGHNFIAEEQNVFFLVDTSGKKLTAGFDTIIHISNGLCVAKNSPAEKTCFIINAQAELSPPFGYIYPLSNGIMRIVSVDYTQYAYADTSGKLITPWYDRGVAHIPTDNTRGDVDLGGFFYGLFRGFMAIASLGFTEFFGVFDSGHSASPEPATPAHHEFPGYRPDYEYFYGTDFHNGYAHTSSSRKEKSKDYPLEQQIYIGIIDSTGKQILNNEYRSIYWSDTFFIVEKKSGYGLVTRSGRVLLPASYGMITSLGNNYFEVQQSQRSGNVNALYHVNQSAGKFLTTFRYYNIAYGGDSMFIVQPDVLRYGYVDAKGKLVIPMIYERAAPFENGRANVMLDWTSTEIIEIDTKGKRIR